MIESVLFLFIMLCYYVLSANQPIFMRENFCVGGCMYYIDATISHGDVSFF